MRVVATYARPHVEAGMPPRDAILKAIEDYSAALSRWARTFEAANENEMGPGYRSERARRRDAVRLVARAVWVQIREANGAPTDL